MLTYIIDATEKLDEALLMAGEQLDRVNQFLALAMRDHGQFVHLITKALVNEVLKKRRKLLSDGFEGSYCIHRNVEFCTYLRILLQFEGL